MPHPPRRPWTWLEPIPYEGVALHIRVGHPQGVILAWVNARGPLPYDDHEDHRYDDQEEPTVYSRLDVTEGRLELLRARNEGEAIDRFEADLVDALLDGALGPLVWDVLEMDVNGYLASGEDASSLAAYLDPSSEEATHRARAAALRSPRVVDCVGATSPLSFLQAVARAIDLGPVDTIEGFSHALATRPLVSLPRRWAVRVSPAMRDQMVWFAKLVARAQTRVRFSWLVV